MQGGFRLRPKCQHLQSWVELTELLLQAVEGVERRGRHSSKWICALCPFCLPQSPHPAQGGQS